MIIETRVIKNVTLENDNRAKMGRHHPSKKFIKTKSLINDCGSLVWALNHSTVLTLNTYLQLILKNYSLNVMIVGSFLHLSSRTSSTPGGTTVPCIFLYCRTQHAESHFVLHWILLLMERRDLFMISLYFLHMKMIVCTRYSVTFC